MSVRTWNIPTQAKQSLGLEGREIPRQLLRMDCRWGFGYGAVISLISPIIVILAGMLE